VFILIDRSVSQQSQSPKRVSTMPFRHRLRIASIASATVLPVLFWFPVIQTFGQDGETPTETLSQTENADLSDSQSSQTNDPLPEIAAASASAGKDQPPVTIPLPDDSSDSDNDFSSLDPPAEPPPSERASEIPLEPMTDQQQALYATFEAKRKVWEQTLVEMKKIQILRNNAVDTSAKSMDRYYELRDRARGELDDVFQAAKAFFMNRSDEYSTVSFLAAMIDYRRTSSYYEDCFEVAQRMVEIGVNMPYLEQMAARSAFIAGKFDEVLPIYQRFVDSGGYEKLENIDKLLASILDFYPQWWEEELKARAADEAAGDLPRVLLKTTSGPVVLELFEDQAPNTVANFIQLVQEGYYDDSEFYQVISDLVVMGGDPLGDGSGTSGRFIPDEHQRPDRRRIFRGSVMMAKRVTAPDSADMVPDSASSQFVIAMMPIVPKEQQQTVFGRVVEGMDVVGSFRRVDPSKKKEQQVILPPDRIITATVLRKRDHDYNVRYAQ
jgi:cyclophilin family peptidyl-prolyl cis-trans isomerase